MTPAQWHWCTNTRVVKALVNKIQTKCLTALSLGSVPKLVWLVIMVTIIVGSLKIINPFGTSKLLHESFLMELDVCKFGCDSKRSVLMSWRNCIMCIQFKHCLEVNGLQWSWVYVPSWKKASFHIVMGTMWNPFRLGKHTQEQGENWTGHYIMQSTWWT